MQLCLLSMHIWVEYHFSIAHIARTEGTGMVRAGLMNTDQLAVLLCCWLCVPASLAVDQLVISMVITKDIKAHVHTC